jgi:cell wall-associated NlpC family hydrolase
LMQIRSKVPNHAAVYIGDGMIMHHMYKRLSTRDMYGGMWADHATHVLRHESNVNQTPDN